MNTPAHLIFGAAAFGKSGQPWVTVAALAGALAPDISLYAMAGWYLFVLGTSPQIVFDQLYFSTAWMQVFRIDNSFILWGIGFAFALWAKSGWAVAFCGAALLHLALDFPFHHDDGRPQFWPLTMWIFESPLSYWDNRRGAAWLGPLEGAACILLFVVIFRRFRSWLMRLGMGVVLALELMSSGFWRFIF